MIDAGRMAIFYGIVTLYVATLVSQVSTQEDCTFPKEMKNYAGHHDRRIPGVRFYHHRATETEARVLCSDWGFELGRLTSFSTFVYRQGWKHIASKNNGKCAFAFIRKRSREIYMCQVSDRCPASLQHRVIPAHQLHDCGDFEETWRVTDFKQDKNSEWLLKNNGHELEIQIHPVGSVKTVLKKGDAERQLVVTKILIKSGTNEKDGSEHSIGIAKHAGEMQIFHESHEEFRGKHALSFMIQERNNPKNRNWNSDFLRHIYRCVEIRSEARLEHSPPILKDLIFEDSGDLNLDNTAQRLSTYIRYEGPSSDISCEKHMWTIFENTIYLNSAQMNFLRRLKKEKVVSSHSIQYYRFSNNYCRHRSAPPR